MTNNLEDFEQPDPGQGGGLPPAQGTRAKLAHAWRTRPLFKLLVLMIVAAAVIAVGISLFSSPPPTEMTKIASPPQTHEAPGGPASPYFVEQTKIAEAERARTAIKTGGSALPTPLGANAGIDDMTKNDKPKTDPLVELRSQIEHQRQQIDQMKQQQTQPAAQQQRAPEPFDNTLAQAMQTQMKQMMTSWEPHGIKQVTGPGLRDEDTKGSKKSDGASTNTSETNPNTQSTALQADKVMVPAGTVSYAQLLTEANSDVPGPILAQIVSGPLSGARAVGAFKVQDEYLVLKFSLANLKGKDYYIDAIALDPDTTLGGMATEVDQRYFTRVILPAAAGFMQGFGQALGQGSSSIVTNGDTTIVQQSGQGLSQGAFQGLAQAGQTLGQFFQNQANNTKPLVRVAAGTPMGLFFVATVVDRNPNQQPYGFNRSGAPLQNYPNGAYGYPYQAGYGVPGAPQNGYYPGQPIPGYYGQTPGVGTTPGATDQPYNPYLPPVQNNRITTNTPAPNTYYGYGYTGVGATP